MGLGKKGLSDIVSAVLLILLVVSISILLFVWISKQSEKGMDKGETLSEKFDICRDFLFEIGDYRCDGGVIYIEVVNNQKNDLHEAFGLRLIYGDEIDESITSYDSIDLLAYESKEIRIFKQQDEVGFFKNVDAVEFIPKIFIDEKAFYCEDNKIKVNVDC